MRLLILLSSVLLGSVLLMACNTVEPVAVTRTTIETPRLVLPDPTPITLRPVVWKVIPGTPTYIALDPTNYTNLGINMLRLQQHISELSEMVKQYKEFYSEGNK